MSVEKDDGELMKLVAAGDKEAFDTIYERHNRGVSAFVWRHNKCHRKEPDEDVVQRVWMKVYKYAGRFRPYSKTDPKLFTWLVNIAFREMTSIMRTAKKNNRTQMQAAVDLYAERETGCDDMVEDILTGIVPSYESRIIASEREMELTAVMEGAAMQRGPQTVKILAGMIEGKTQREIGKEMGISHQRVDQILGKMKTAAKNLLTTCQNKGTA